MSKMKIKLEKQSTKDGCAAYFIISDGKCKGTVQKCSFYHKGHRMQCTSYTVFIGHKLTLSPHLHWPAYMRIEKGVKFEQKVDPNNFGFAETGHKVRGRMMTWIKEQLQQDLKCSK